jgi:hypothetical protein
MLEAGGERLTDRRPRAFGMAPSGQPLACATLTVGSSVVPAAGSVGSARPAAACVPFSPHAASARTSRVMHLRASPHAASSEPTSRAARRSRPSGRCGERRGDETVGLLLLDELAQVLGAALAVLLA